MKKSCTAKMNFSYLPFNKTKMVAVKSISLTIYLIVAFPLKNMPR